MDIPSSDSSQDKGVITEPETPLRTVQVIRFVSRNERKTREALNRLLDEAKKLPW